MLYGSFAGKPAAALPAAPVTQFRPFGASRMRYGSFAGKPAADLPVVAVAGLARRKRRRATPAEPSLREMVDAALVLLDGEPAVFSAPALVRAPAPALDVDRVAAIVKDVAGMSPVAGMAAKVKISQHPAARRAEEDEAMFLIMALW